MNKPQTVEELHEALVGVARELAACQWYGSPSYETTTGDLIDAAVERTKAQIGESLLRALGEER